MFSSIYGIYHLLVSLRFLFINLPKISFWVLFSPLFLLSLFFTFSFSLFSLSCNKYNLLIFVVVQPWFVYFSSHFFADNGKLTLNLLYRFVPNTPQTNSYFETNVKIWNIRTNWFFKCYYKYWINYSISLSAPQHTAYIRWKTRLFFWLILSIFGCNLLASIHSGMKGLCVSTMIWDLRLSFCSFPFISYPSFNICIVNYVNTQFSVHCISCVLEISAQLLKRRLWRN